MFNEYLAERQAELKELREKIEAHNPKLATARAAVSGFVADEADDQETTDTKRVTVNTALHLAEAQYTSLKNEATGVYEQIEHLQEQYASDPKAAEKTVSEMRDAEELARIDPRLVDPEMQDDVFRQFVLSTLIENDLVEGDKKVAAQAILSIVTRRLA